MGSKKVRVYDLAKELKIDNKKAIEEIRREGVDVSVPSNSVPDDVAERIRNKYYPKKAAAPAAPRLVKAAKPLTPAEGFAPIAVAHAEHADEGGVAVATAPAAEETETKPAGARVRVLKASPQRKRDAEETFDEAAVAFEDEEAARELAAEIEAAERALEAQEGAEVDEGAAPGADSSATVRVRRIVPTAQPDAEQTATAAKPAAGTTVRVLTRKPGMESIMPTAPTLPKPLPVPGRPSYEPTTSVEGGPVKLPAHTTYVPPRDKARPRGLRGGGRAGKKGFRDAPAARDRATANDGRPPQLARAGIGGLVKKPVFDELKAIRLVEGTTLKDFAEKLDIKPKDVVATLLGRGVMATINQTLNQDVAKDVAAEFGFDVTFVPYEEMVVSGDTDLIDVGEGTGVLESRAPVVTVMGHVDHGKTSLLDAIRSARVAEGEAGGITQHISAFSVDIPDPDEKELMRRIVFIDTPGHEAFTMMRARGAKVTDVVVLVVAADDGVMPQTVEAIDHAKAADVPIIVAINKIDKADANPERVKQELTEHGLLWDGWGGETVMVELSAKQKINLDSLLEMIVLTSDLKELKATAERLATGVVLDAFLDKGRGAVATVLVQNGTLKVGDPFIVGPVFGRVRALFDDLGKPVEMVGPSTPVQVLGANGVPHAGDVFQAVDDVAKAQHVSSFRQSQQRMERIAADSRRGLDSLFADLQQGQVKELQIILKADVQGSVEAVKDTLNKLSTDKVKIRVVHSGVGAVNESDVMLASATNKDMNRAAVIIGFNVRPDARAEEVARNEGVDIRLHTIIYKVQEEIRDAMVGMLDKTKKEVALGQAEIRNVIRVPKVGNVAGCMVLDGLIKRGSEARLLRDNVVTWTGRVESLRRFKDDVAEVKQGFECGITLERYQDIRVGDVIEAYRTEEVAQTEL
ncbi:MAG TPA: translation initiation factor IF-2 [Blastocatellia bacterium]|nr:translation initiation factor IF-2 [Blastocatellia bacterium]